ncbi:MAG TPA: glycosyltransferase family 39 protein [Thermoanaerobaculia bacterium]|jgi:4-amino-4-deoxy-L-arabinose transferase-like glycosyltransferase|nr:glycosyltransferase family 39 protein [Thermoanaerobaculia bacterium]
MKRTDIAALALIVLSMLRIASTWTVFSVTVDEPMHISAGLQLYTQHVYTYQPENPPLPRVVLALVPWLGGMDFDPARRVDEQLLRVFHSDGRYETNLVLARAGNLVFFVIASLATWWWARRELGAVGGFVATLLFTFQPIVAGHAGLATHDVAATAGVAVSLLAFTRWLDARTVRSAALFGAAFGFTVLCKFSCIGYVPAACLAMFIVRRDPRWRTLAPSFVAALIATLLVIWTGYGFTIEKLVAGIRGLAAIDRAGFFTFLFGEVRTTGWWWYFPAAVALKSTIASLVLALFTRRRGLEALAAAIAILLVAMPSHLDLGVRYVLPLYAPLAVAGAAAMVTMKFRWIAIALLLWHTGASVATHPDAFPYFNEAAGRQPWRLLLDSNIDWGQDVLRLRRVIREKKIERIGLAVQGWHDWDALGFPPHYDLNRDVPSQGWVAASEHVLGLARRAPWLEGRPYERVGKSIRLYYVP